MKIRQLPEDFKVEEINEIAVSKDRRGYRLYLLEKKNLETFSTLMYISRISKIPVSELGIAGLKDRHAVTKQYLTAPSKYNLNAIHKKNLNLTFLGYTDNSLNLGDLKFNKFEVTVRDITKGELEGISKKAKTIEQMGVPNYFDSQRFGSVINKQFIAKYIIKRDYENAVKIYLTSFSKFESSKIKKEKRLIQQHWGDFSKLNIKTPSLSTILKEYKKSRSWLEAYKKITPLLIIISAYQSYLWNECIKKVLLKLIHKRKLYSITYNIGSLLFYKNLDKDELDKIPQTFKTISDMITPTPFEQNFINKILETEGITLKDFDIKKQTGNFFKTHERKVILKPLHFRISNPEIDELNDKGKNNRFKITLNFILPKGSYATVITKRIFNQ